MSNWPWHSHHRPFSMSLTHQTFSPFLHKSPVSLTISESLNAGIIINNIPQLSWTPVRCPSPSRGQDVTSVRWQHKWWRWQFWARTGKTLWSDPTNSLLFQEPHIKHTIVPPQHRAGVSQHLPKWSCSLIPWKSPFQMDQSRPGTKANHSVSSSHSTEDKQKWNHISLLEMQA